MQNSEYNFSKIEPKWQKYWADKNTFQATDFDSRPKFYILDMFPYPSGAGLHIGHPEVIPLVMPINALKSLRATTCSPNGWDAFGLPTEQYAIKTGKHQETTKTNVENFKKQLKQIGLCYDWERKLTQLTLTISSGLNGYSFSYSKVSLCRRKTCLVLPNWEHFRQ